MPTKTLVTGAAGFIGFHTALRLLEHGENVVGVDNMNAYYDVKLKEARLALLEAKPNFTFYRISVEEHLEVAKVFEKENFDRVIHLAAQAGIRSPPSKFHRYVSSNLVGFSNILDSCRIHKIQHLVYASSSSVYGDVAVPPFKVQDAADHPQSLYAATKRANELMAYSYSHQYQIPTTGLRFFTVYGPWGRPDMAVYNFTDKIDSGQTIEVYGKGEVTRDFTYVDDVVEAILKIVEKPPHLQMSDIRSMTPKAPSQIFNVGSGRPISVNRLVSLLEDSLDKKAVIRFKPRPVEDMQITHADIQGLEDVIGPLHSTQIEYGIAQFVTWYRAYRIID
ncbi:NAD-dependent epimerase/dehydratase family protein [Candidatus Poseidoniaceae archaeon]|nr:NAD-dependent epimerase/dehydratase family protein [Candidatus Poseidoniaceae archaeon]